MKYCSKKVFTTVKVLAVLILFALSGFASATPQKNKDKKKEPPKIESSADSKALLPDSQVIDRTVSEALGYWQIGDVDSMHKYYSDDVLVVSGLWEQPIIGWDNYVKAYLAQRARVANGRLDRSNTYIKVNGNSAWTSYQWNYYTSTGGKVSDVRGHTTLILNKQGDRWVIVLDHSSALPDVVTINPPAANAPAQPGQP